MSRKLPVFLASDEPERLLQAADTWRDRVLSMVLLYLGLRVAEVCALKVGDIDFRRRFVMVRQGKGSKDRSLPLPEKLLRPLRGWIGRRQNGHVFPSRQGGGPLTTRSVQLLMKRLASRAGLRDALAPRRVTPHKLRHSFASRMLERGANINAVKDALGHSSIATTQVYLHTSPEHLREAMEI